MLNIFKNKVKNDMKCSSDNAKFNVLDFDALLEINNKELKTILNYVDNDSIFFNDDMRLLSKDEIENFEEQCDCKIGKYIPLIDVYDNNFIVYDLDNDNFLLYNIVDEISFNKNFDIKNIIDKMNKYFASNNI